MSIDAKLRALEAAGELIKHVPTVETAEPISRQLYLAPATHRWCFPEGKHPDRRVTEEAMAYAHQQLNSFVLGRYLDDRDFWRLGPEEEEVWEIKTHMDPRIRLFGWFPAINKFIAVHHKLRQDLERVNGPKWRAAMRRTGEIRDELMPEFIPFIAPDLKYYVTL